jgi:hypothetical protein
LAKALAAKELGKALVLGSAECARKTTILMPRTHQPAP